MLKFQLGGYMGRSSSRGTAGQAKVAQSSAQMQQVMAQSAQELAAINQEAFLELSQLIQDRMAGLMKVQSPQDAFESIQSDILRDSAVHIAAYQKRIKESIRSSNDELQELAQQMIEQSKSDLIHFINQATHNAPPSADVFVSSFKSIFNHTMQNFELLRASTADSFNAFEDSVKSIEDLAQKQMDALLNLSKHHSKR